MKRLRAKRVIVQKGGGRGDTCGQTRQIFNDGADIPAPDTLGARMAARGPLEEVKWA